MKHFASPVSSLRQRIRDRSDRGESLIEILLAILVIGIVTVAAVYSLTGVLGLAGSYRTTTNLEVATSNAASEVRSALQFNSAPGVTPVVTAKYSVCATADTYGPHGTNPVDFTQIPAGYSVAITQVQYWNGTSFTSTCTPPLPHTVVTALTTPGEQLVTIVATSNATHQTMTLNVVVDNPFGPSVPLAAPGATQLVMLSQPTNTTDTNFIPPFAVAVENLSGAIQFDVYTQMVATITPNTGNPAGVLSSSCLGAENGGVFTFNNCNINTVVPALVKADDEAEPAWVFRRLSCLGERMESWTRSRLDRRGIRLS